MPMRSAKQRLLNSGVRQVGYGNETPADMPRPLTVGQRVTGRHPLTRQIHDGTVLTVAPNAYR